MRRRDFAAPVARPDRSPRREQFEADDADDDQPHARQATRVGEDPRTTQRVLLHEAEAALTDFRADVREELRLAVADERLSRETVRVLLDGLGEVRRRLVQDLRS